MNGTPLFLAALLCLGTFPIVYTQSEVRLLDGSHCKAVLSGRSVISHFYNPAALELEGDWICFAKASNPYGIQGLNSLGAGAAVRLSENATAGISIERYGDEFFHRQDLGLSYGMKIGEILQAGAALKLAGWAIEGYGKAVDLQADLGCVLHLGENYRAGVLLHNPLGKTTTGTDSETTLVSCEFSYQSMAELQIFSGFRMEQDHPLGIRAGFRYRPLGELDFGLAMISAPFHLMASVSCTLIPTVELEAGMDYHQWLGWTPSVLISWSPSGVSE